MPSTPSPSRRAARGHNHVPPHILHARIRALSQHLQQLYSLATHAGAWELDPALMQACATCIAREAGQQHCYEYTPPASR